jgi:hypothetical protein
VALLELRRTAECRVDRAARGPRRRLLRHFPEDAAAVEAAHAAKLNYAAAQAAGVPVTIRYCESGGHGRLVEKCPDLWRAWVDEFLAGFPELQAAGG